MTVYAAYPEVTHELLDRIVRRILEVGCPERIVLFGSRARGMRAPTATERLHGAIAPLTPSPPAC